MGGLGGLEVLVDISDVWPESTRDSHKKYVEGLLDKERSKRIPWGSSSISGFIERNIQAVSVGGVKAILKAIRDFDRSSSEYGSVWSSRASRKFDSVFDYSKFSRKSLAGWSAYELCRSAKYNICPYCQQSFAMTVFRGGERCFRPTLDHFYPKSRFPFLSLSLYNLVPSCYTCNSSLKGSKDFHAKRHMHPYEGSSGVGFELDMDRYQKGKFSGVHRWRANVANQIGAGYVNSVKTFAIKERYECIEGAIARFAECAYQYYCVGNKRYDQIFEGELLKVDEVISLNFDEENYKNELFGRLKRDIVLQMRRAVELE